MAEDEPIPNAEEIRSQLERMLAGKRFKAASNQADFLALVVHRALAGKKTSEEIIGRKLFGEKFRKDESSDVRVTASNLRKSLVLYRDHEGREDPIIIALPEPPADKRIKLLPGESYRPIFAYNPYREVGREYRLGLYFLSAPRPFELAYAIEHFRNVLAIDPHHAGAHIGMVEAMCLLALTGSPATLYVSAAVELAPNALKFGPANWHAHAAAGAAWLLSAEIELAKEAFTEALALDKREALTYGWYHAFLLATNQQTEALKLARLRVDANVDDALVNAIYGFYLYTCRQFESATDFLKRAIELDANCWSAHSILALVLFASGDAFEALVRLSYVDHVLQLTADHFFLPGLKALLRTSSHSRHDHPDVQAAAKLLLEETTPPCVQIALLYMSVDNKDEALESLLHAWSSYEPAILILDLLPVFDALREQDGFQIIVNSRFLKRPEPPSLSQPKWKRNSIKDLAQGTKLDEPGPTQV